MMHFALPRSRRPSDKSCLEAEPMLTADIGYRLRRRAWAVAFVSTLTVLASAKHKVLSEIPIENSPRFGLLLVKAEVNGKPAVLIVDTGSTISVISTKLTPVSDRYSNDVMVPRNGSQEPQIDPQAITRGYQRRTRDQGTTRQRGLHSKILELSNRFGATRTKCALYNNQFFFGFACR